MLDVIEKILNQTDKDVTNENANVSGSEPQGIMAIMAGSVGQEYALENLLNKDVAELHRRGYIHIHDLDYYPTGTTTCLQIPVGKLLKDGFSVKDSHMREPSNITSAFALVAVIFQIHQNMQHGGQAMSAIDVDLEPYVAKTFKKHRQWFIDKGIDEYEASDLAKEKTIEETNQAAEAFVHNMNSMTSRGGGQTVFSSINFGLGTTDGARTVSRALLRAMKNGLGKGEQPIFPIMIFQLKDGVNMYEGDPNYDLFEESLSVTAERFFPNYVFLDADFNKRHYDADKPETWAASMGCVDGREVVTYKIDDYLFVESIQRMFERVSADAEIKTQGLSKYCSPENVKIYDSSKEGFVKCLKVIMNPNKGDWKLLKMSNGRNLIATSDHPLPTQRGRLELKDIKPGDHIPVTYDQYFEEKVEYGVKRAWVDGLIVCDGCYDSNITVTLGLDEEDIADRFIKWFEEVYNLVPQKYYRNRGERGNYIEIRVNKFDYKIFREVFGGKVKMSRRIPNSIFSSKREDRLSFLAGMIDADGHVKTKNNNRVVAEIGSLNKELALQQMLLAQSLGIEAKSYTSKYKSKVSDNRYHVTFLMTYELSSYLASSKKNEFEINEDVSLVTNTYSVVKSVKDLPDMDAPSFDVETESDKFDVSGIVSHNCRTRTLENVNGEARTIGRGNLSFTSINLPMIAIECETIEDFLNDVKEMTRVACEQLYDRYRYQINRSPKNFDFIYDQETSIGSKEAKDKNDLSESLKHGTLSVGFVGLAEAMVELFGKHHGESEEVLQYAIKTIETMKSVTDEFREKLSLNYAVIATPAESFAGKALKKTVAMYGIRKGVTDREYFTNSFHVPVWHKIPYRKKVEIEGNFHKLCLAGHITYVEVGEMPGDNLEAMKDIVYTMANNNIGYGAINIPVDKCNKCRFTSTIYDECPKCGSTDIKRIRRITGYLVGDMNRWNSGKEAEERDRVKHV